MLQSNNMSSKKNRTFSNLSA